MQHLTQRRSLASFHYSLAVAVLFGWHSTKALADEPEGDEPAEKVASFTTPVESPQLRRNPQQHPLYPALALAEQALESINENVDDYTCKIIRRERVDGKLGGHELIDAKVRHASATAGSDTPFSVYLRFLKPSSVEGREALYVEGEHAGKVFVRRGGQRMAYMSSFIKPDSRLAMKDNRYPITDIGFKRLVERLISVIENDMQYDECEVQFFKGAKVGDRKCTRVEVVHPVERDHFTFNRAMVFVDDKDKLPVGYASFYWPRKAGEKPRLLEEYVYTNVKLNVGLTDEDFDRDNPEYGFTRSQETADNAE